MLTIPEFFENCVEKFADNVLIKEKVDGQYKGTTYEAMRRMVYLMAGGLIELGVKKGERIALISEGRNDWVMSELAVLYTGAINVPISVKIEEHAELKFRLAHSECRFAIVSGRQYPKVREIKKDLADLDYVILLDPIKSYEEDEIYITDIIEKGKAYLSREKEEFEQKWKSIKKDDPANICYTSGTTSDPKGIILSHRNYTANVEQASALFDIPSYYTSLLILPWDHSFAHTAGIYSLMKGGASMASVDLGESALETLRNIPINIKETQPTFLLSVPALAKNFKKNIEKAIKKKGPKVEKMFHKALEIAYQYNGNGWDTKKKFSPLLKIQYTVYDKLIFSKIRENFGGKMKFFVGGGALLDIELQNFFYAIGIPMYQGYGLSEAAPIISANNPDEHKLGSSGKLVPDLELKIVDDNGKVLPHCKKGEIVVKGENVMLGYWKNDKATRETLKDGWLHTGDMGYLDEEGFLYVLGRFKSLLIGNDGEKFSPEGIEEAYVEHSAFIEQIMLYNNQNPYTVALLVPNKEAILTWTSERSVSTHTKEGQEAILKLIQSEIEQFADGGKYEGQFPNRWLPAAIAVLGEGFTEENHLLNSTLKMVRGKIVEYYHNRIDYLYTPEAKNICNHQNMTIVSRF